MTIIEQILLKLGIDQSQVGPGMNEFQRKVEEGTRHGAKSFVHVESAGKSFKKLVHEISDASPLMGLALRAAINPVTAVLLSATMAFGKFREAQKEAAAEAKESAREVREAWLEAQEALYSENPRKELAAGAVRSAKAATTKEMPSESPKMGREWLRLFLSGMPFGKLSIGQSDLNAERAEGVANARSATADAQYRAALENKQQADRKGKALDEEKKKRSEIDKLHGEALQNEEQAHRRAMGHQEKIQALLQDRAKLDRIALDKRETEETRAKAVLEISKLDRQVAEERKAIDKDRADQAERKARAESQAADLARRVAFQQDMARTNQFAGFQPSVEELANSPIAWRNNPGAARQARYIQWLESAAREQVLSGYVEGARETIFGKGGARELRADLEKMGLVKPEVTMERMQEAMSSLAERAANAGLNVNVKNAD